jgi:VanZ family protein
MHSENKVAKGARYWYDAVGKKILFAALLILTGLFCEWPDFHPEHYFGSAYHWWLDIIFHGGYYFVITILLYIVFCRGRQVALFWITVLLSSYLFEALQKFVPGRSFSLLDMTSNLVGISLGTIICTLFYKRQA